MTSHGSEEIAVRPSLPATTRVGRVELTVTDLDRSVAFYESSLGLRLHRREDPVAALGAGREDIVVLVEDRGARPPGRHAGLYHFALLYPSRLELARSGLLLAATRTPIQGASDHGTHEAIYLPDPDGNGVEIAADRPREMWPDLGEAQGGPDPLDLRGLLQLVGDEEPRLHSDPGLTLGHVHLHVNELEPATRFYRDLIGFDTTMVFPTAVFVSAGGYHHHVGFNTWRGEHIPPAPPDGVVGLRLFTILTNDTDVDAIRRRIEDAGLDYEERDDGMLLHDPAGHALLVVAS